jgi:hypothetical protein
MVIDFSGSALSRAAGQSLLSEGATAQRKRCGNNNVRWKPRPQVERFVSLGTHDWGHTAEAGIWILQPGENKGQTIWGIGDRGRESCTPPPSAACLSMSVIGLVTTGTSSKR